MSFTVKKATVLLTSAHPVLWAVLLNTEKFLIYTDGKLAARSGKLTASMDAVPIWADVRGCKELKLVVSDANDGIYGDIADWCDAALRK